MSPQYIQGYEWGPIIARSRRCIVYYATEVAQSRRVAIKTCSAQPASPRDIALMRREWSLLDKLAHVPGVISAHTLIENDGNAALVMDDGGQRLTPNALRDSHGQLDIDRFFSTAIRVIDIVDAVHEAGFIHKDLKPDNLLIQQDQQDQQVQQEEGKGDIHLGDIHLIDFGIATELPRESQQFARVDAPNGSLPYLSPEQTGRINQPLDYRSDYYSLGITLYEWLTGTLPFRASSRLDWLYCHLTQPAPDARANNPAVPRALADLVRKLMAKDVEDRYQCRRSLLDDFERCRQLWRKGELDRRIELGRDDRSRLFTVSSKLYGRERERAVLVDALDRVAADAGADADVGADADTGHKKAKSELILITGPSGVGKSALVKELFAPIARRRGFFAEGKFERLVRDRPYLALSQALSAVMKEVLGQAKDVRDAWSERLQRALTPHGQIAVDIVPLLAQLIGPQPALEALQAAEAEARVLQTLWALIDVFARREHPLVIFLDDLQWSDAGTRRLLQNWLRGNRFEALMIIGAYRDNEVGDDDPLMATIADIQGYAAVTSIALTPLTLGDIANLVADSLHLSGEESRALAAMIAEKTGGTAFYVGQMLEDLYHRQLIRYHSDTGRWQWDATAIADLQVSDNVAEYMTGRLARLPADSKRVLQLAACIGNRFDLQTLVAMGHRPLVDVCRALAPALREGFIAPLSRDYTLAANYDNNGQSAAHILYRFQHDQIQTASAAGLSLEAQKRAHLSAGRILLSRYRREKGDADLVDADLVDADLVDADLVDADLGDADLGDTDLVGRHLMDLAKHFNTAIDYIDDRDERHDIAALNLRAGRKAKEALAYDVATTLLRYAVQLLGDDAWDRAHTLSLAVYSELATCSYFAGDSAHAEALFDQCLKRATTGYEKAKTLQDKLLMWRHSGKHALVYQTGRQALSMLGVALAERPNPLHAMAQFLRIDLRRRLAAQPRIARGADKSLDEQNDELGRELLVTMIPSASIALGLPVGLYLALKAIRHYGRHGEAYELALPYIVCGTFIAHARKNFVRGVATATFGRKIEDAFAERNQNKSAIYFPYVHFLGVWHTPRADMPDQYRLISEAAVQSGNRFHEAFGLVCRNLFLFVHGHDLGELSQLVARTHYRLVEQRIPPLIAVNHHIRLGIALLVGSASDNERVPPASEVGSIGDALTEKLLSVTMLYTALMCGDWQCAMTWFERSPALEHHLGVYLADFMVWQSMLLFECGRGDQGKQRAALRQAQGFHARIDRWRPLQPGNFDHLVQLLGGEIARAQGKHLQAQQEYQRALATVADRGMYSYRALIAERAASHCRQAELPRFAETYRYIARQAYTAWGAYAVLADLEKSGATGTDDPETWSYDSRTTMVADDDSISTRSSTGNLGIARLDIESLLQVSELLNREIVLDRLIEQFIRYLMKNAGADRVVLILVDEGDARVVATAEGERVDFLADESLDTTACVPKQVVFHCLQRGEPVIIANAQRSGATSSGATSSGATSSGATSSGATSSGADSGTNASSARSAPFTSDPYFATHKPKAIMCLRLDNRSIPVGLIYLENHVIKAAFHHERVALVRTLSTQAAISLQNAGLYARLAAANASLEAEVVQDTGGDVGATGEAGARDQFALGGA